MGGKEYMIGNVGNNRLHVFLRLPYRSTLSFSFYFHEIISVST